MFAVQMVYIPLLTSSQDMWIKDDGSYRFACGYATPSTGMVGSPGALGPGEIRYWGDWLSFSLFFHCSAYKWHNSNALLQCPAPD